jgi:hypothetical protein
MYIMKYFGNLFFLVPLNPLDPSATGKYSFVVVVEPDAKFDSLGVSHTPSGWLLATMNFPHPYGRSMD